MAARLTELDRVKLLLYASSQQQNLAMTVEQELVIAMLIGEVSDRAEKEADRSFAEASYTEYADGTGNGVLYLRQGPIVDVTSVAELDDAAAETAVDAADYRVGGLRAEGETGQGVLYRLGSCWPCGRRNIKVEYSAGFVEAYDGLTDGAYPLRLVQHVTNAVAAAYLTRALHGLISAGESGGTTIPQEAMDAAFDRGLDPFRRRRVV